jgi:xanthine dehydrogenase small subunit
MIKFILNNQTIETELPRGTTVLDFARYYKNLKGTKIGCREGDCGACTVLVGELSGETIKYRTQTSCLMPLANADGKHVVTVEGINRADGELTPVQSALVEQSGTQCGFCTVGFVMSLTNFCIDDTPKTAEMAVSAIDGNICRCTGYKSIERACETVVGGQRSVVSEKQSSVSGQSAAVGNENLRAAIVNEIVPEYFDGIKEKLVELQTSNRPPTTDHRPLFLGGGTDLYVQRPEEMVHSEAENLFDNSQLRFITESDEFVEFGASVVVTDLLESDVFQRLFPDLYKHLKLVSSTPIRNMATIAGNFVNASPIGDMTAWFLALDAEILVRTASGSDRVIPLRDFYLGYKQLAKRDEEFITKIRFRKDFTHFNFEKVCKRTYLDIATVNTAIALKSVPPASAGGFPLITNAHVSAGGVFATPLYLRKTSEHLRGQKISESLVKEAAEILQSEIAPISDVRGTAEYKRLLARQLFTAHFVELFEI